MPPVIWALQPQPLTLKIKLIIGAVPIDSSDKQIGAQDCGKGRMMFSALLSRLTGFFAQGLTWKLFSTMISTGLLLTVATVAYVRGLENDRLTDRVQVLEEKLNTCNTALTAQQESEDVRAETMEEYCKNLRDYYDSLPERPGMREGDNEEGLSESDYISPHNAKDSSPQRPSRWSWW